MEDYAQLLLITQRKKLQEYIDDTHDMDGLVAWYNKTKARIGPSVPTPTPLLGGHHHNTGKKR